MQKLPNLSQQICFREPPMLHESLGSQTMNSGVAAVMFGAQGEYVVVAGPLAHACTGAGVVKFARSADVAHSATDDATQFCYPAHVTLLVFGHSVTLTCDLAVACSVLQTSTRIFAASSFQRSSSSSAVASLMPLRTSRYSESL